MDIKQAYKVMQAASGIKVGDKVKVLRMAKDYEMGWREVWAATMDEMVDKSFKTTRLTEQGVYCANKHGNSYCFPFFVLEIVEKAKQEKMIDIYGKMWSESSIAEALKNHAYGVGK